MSEKKSPANSRQKPGAKSGKVEFAGGNKCVYCGKALESGNESRVLKVAVQTKSFPVCSENCRDSLNTYIEKDNKLKKYMYIMILIAAVCILASALSGIQPLTLAGLTIAGLAFLFLPYPISRFETFQSTCVRTVSIICRVVGAILIAFTLVLYLFA